MIVAGTFCASVVAKMNFTCSGGSSSVLSRALKAPAAEHVHLVDQVDFIRSARRGIGGIVPQFTNVIDPIVARAVDFKDVQAAAFGNLPARIAFAARNGSRTLRAIQRLGEDARCGSLADSARTDEKIRLRDASRRDGILQGCA